MQHIIRKRKATRNWVDAGTFSVRLSHLAPYRLRELTETINAFRIRSSPEP